MLPWRAFRLGASEFRVALSRLREDAMSRTNRKWWIGAVATAAGWMLIGQPAYAAPITIAANAGDAQIEETPDSASPYTVNSYVTKRSTDTTLYAGTLAKTDSGNRARAGVNAIFIFQLPDNPGAVSSANLAFTIHGQTSGSNYVSFSKDLYGFGYRSTPTIDATGTTQDSVDYFEGAFGTDPSATAIQESILTSAASQSSAPSMPNGTRVETDATGDSNLVTFLNTVYANGAQAGDYVFFRLNDQKDINTNVGRYYTLASAEDTANAPELSITFVPEPTSLGLLGIGGLMLLSRRRKGARAA
jgi:hypothetical protein